MVCLFAIGMATFLNYYKYKSTVTKTVTTRLLVVGRGIENSVQSSLALGMTFAELGTLPGLIEREKTADRLITAIEVFDTSGRVLYSTERGRAGGSVAARWIEAATRAAGSDWFVEEADNAVAGLALKNNFNLTVGYLVIRYARDELERNVGRVGMELLAIGAAALLGAVLLAWLALLPVLARFERDMRALEQRIAAPDAAGTGQVPDAFASAVEELRAVIWEAEGGLAQARAKLEAVR